jgi:hypothetical protein
MTALKVLKVNPVKDWARTGKNILFHSILVIFSIEVSVIQHFYQDKPALLSE